MKTVLLGVSGFLISVSSFAGDNSSGGPNMPPYSIRTNEIRAISDSPLVLKAIGINNEIVKMEFLKKEDGLSHFDVAIKNCSVTALVRTKGVLSGPVVVPKMTVESVNGNCN
jgi:hypothetical protein